MSAKQPTTKICCQKCKIKRNVLLFVINYVDKMSLQLTPMEKINE